jgi:hypothetical protein
MMGRSFFIYKWMEHGFFHSMWKQTFSIPLELQGTQYELA